MDIYQSLEDAKLMKKMGINAVTWQDAMGC